MRRQSVASVRLQRHERGSASGCIARTTCSTARATHAAATVWRVCRRAAASSAAARAPRASRVASRQTARVGGGSLVEGYRRLERARQAVVIGVGRGPRSLDDRAPSAAASHAGAAR